MSKYNIDLDYVIPRIDISWDELHEIEAGADKIISENKESNENMAFAYLKKAQIMQKGKGGHTCGFIFYDETWLRVLLPKDRKEIKKLLEKAMESIPNMPEALMQLGLFNNSGLGDMNSKAIKFISKAIQLKPDYAAAFNNRAMLFYRFDFFVDKNDKEKLEKNQSYYKNAVTDLTEAIKLRPFDALYYLNRATFHSRLGEHKEAVEDYFSAIKYASDVLKDKLNTEVLILNLRGKEYTELKDYDKAVEDFTESLRLIPKYPDNENDTLLLRGKAYYMAGEKGKAKADIEEYLNRKRKEAETTGLSKIFRIVGINPEDIL
jgi:tetratricopeptide (TPR) repeat protein